jgi:hypothetical protein
MKYDYATSHYHIKPGQTYRSDKDGQLHRWRDTSGARNPQNEDIYKGADINVHYHIQALDSAGIERVLSDHADRIENHLVRVRKRNASFAAVV